MYRSDLTLPGIKGEYVLILLAATSGDVVATDDKITDSIHRRDGVVVRVAILNGVPCEKSGGPQKECQTVFF